MRKYVSYIRTFTTIYENILQGENKQAEQNLVNKTEDINDILLLDGKKNLLKVIRDQSIYRRIVNLDGYFSRIKEWEKTISA